MADGLEIYKFGSSQYIVAALAKKGYNQAFSCSDDEPHSPSPVVWSEQFPTWISKQNLDELFFFFSAGWNWK
ncbi:hypothetical protein L1987_23621 [Smallanthus sonchifolius]|uniref:Uncharacterized protein n=1 Tax=Smallanthus sonchifolius TaxID=185202 RepID=A0ACB9IKS7_9ASTR|nr:hypothetical protein L1987_23621 [Smallanthus sonchifolius]